MASEKITVTIPAEVLAPAPARAGPNLSAYVAPAPRSHLIREAMTTLEQNLSARSDFRSAHEEWHADMSAEQDEIAAARGAGQAECGAGRSGASAARSAASTSS